MKKNPTVKTEKYFLGELPTSWEEGMNRETLSLEMDEISHSNRDILSKYKPEDMADAIRAKMTEGKTDKKKEIPFPSAGSRLPYLIPAAAMVLFGLFIPFLFQVSEKSPEVDITRVKGLGEPDLKVYREIQGKSEVLELYDSAAESDLIQLAYQVSEPVFGMIISVDGRGIVTRHLPEGSETAVPLKTGGQQLLPYSYELDDAPEYETFYLITSDTAFPVAPIIDLIAGEARENHILLDIPGLLKQEKLDTMKIGTIHQYAVPILKEDH